jgi:hypothetical protein
MLCYLGLTLDVLCLYLSRYTVFDFFSTVCATYVKHF